MWKVGEKLKVWVLVRSSIRHANYAVRVRLNRSDDAKAAKLKKLDILKG
jgi:hypothetical protein